METDHNPTLENQDQVVACSEEDQQQQGPISQVRSYECTFCKRGFSNAQALGGHMNIHRKDRAKLKQPSNSNQLSMELSKINTSCNPVTLNQRNLELQPNKSCTRKWPWIFPRDDRDVVLPKDDHVEEIHQLPLFEETPASSKKRELGSSYHDTGGDHGGEEGTESNPSLDLELRLGTEPHDTSTRTGTIEFF